MLYALIPSLMVSVLTNHYQIEGEKLAKELLNKIDLNKLKTPEGEPVKGKSCDDCKASLESPDNLIRNIKEELSESEDQLLVFVSFSMPDLSLEELSKQAGKFHARLVLRGLHEGSFKKTAEKILEIDKNGLKIDIDPELFKEYQIKQVPTFVLIKNGKEVNRLSGNISLEYAKEELEKP